MAEQPWEPETPDEDLPQEPGVPGGEPAPEQEREGAWRSPTLLRTRTASTRLDRPRSLLRFTDRAETGRFRL
jgi:hypothetical protein